MVVKQIKYKEQIFDVVVDDADSDLLEKGLRVSTQRVQNGTVILYPTVSKNGFNRNNGDCRFLHLMIAERLLERAIRNDEVVHHLNGDHFDCVRSNFLILKPAEHGRLHSAMGMLFAKQTFQSPLDDEKIQLVEQLLSRKMQVVQGGMYRII